MNRTYMIIALILLVALLGWLLWGNSALMVTEYCIESRNLPAGFEGFRIAQISDLHNAEFGKDNQKLLSMLAQAQPDIIVMTGDLIDSRRTNGKIVESFAESAMKIAPCYYVTGNHEAKIRDLSGLLLALTEAGVRVLRDESVILEKNGDTITLAGVDDPMFVTNQKTVNGRTVMKVILRNLLKENSGYTILLSHRPEWFTLYCEFDIDLVFSGHAHGGQFRFPFVGGLVAPNQGFFPEYDAGVFRQAHTTMVVSRGLGPSIIPLRIGNRPEFVVAELHGGEK